MDSMNQQPTCHAPLTILTEISTALVKGSSVYSTAFSFHPMSGPFVRLVVRTARLNPAYIIKGKKRAAKER